MTRQRNTIDGSKVAAGGVFYLALLILVQVFAIAQSPLSPRPYIKNEYRTGAVLWTQSAAEYRALAYQSFALARLRLNENLWINAGHGGRAIGRPTRSLHPAVIVDIDETLLDNSRYQGELVLRGLPHDPQIWREWCQRAEAAAVPGAVDFLTHAARRSVRIFYVTNRRQPEKAGTVENLQKLGFPDVSEKTVILREEDSTSSKESRRQQIAARYRVVLLIGDSLSDFSDNFTSKSIKERAAEVDRERKEFGSRFIILPNPMYGDWEYAIYDNRSSLTEMEKHEYRYAALKGFSLLTSQTGLF